MGNTVAIYVKCRPQNADITELVRQHRRVFLGYPPFIRGVDPSLPIEERIHALSDEGRIASERLDDDCRSRAYRAAITLQQNVVRQVSIGSVVLVPQLGSGICLLARTVSTFKRFPPGQIGEEYLRLRIEQGLPVDQPEWHLADVIQGWETSEWKEVPFAWIPRWIGQRALQRNTLGIIADRDGHHRAFEVLDRMMRSEKGGIAPYDDSDDAAEILRRLVDLLSPASFEHLVVDLMRLEQPDLTWLHVGGSGDGGADGVGFRSDGSPGAILQCKLRWPGRLEDPRRRGYTSALVLIVASLDAIDDAPMGASIWGPEAIAQAVIRHAAKLPVARALRVIGAA